MLFNLYKIYDDGKIIADDVFKNSDIYIYGNVKNIECEGSVYCNDVKGSIIASGSVKL